MDNININMTSEMSTNRYSDDKRMDKPAFTICAL